MVNPEYYLGNNVKRKEKCTDKVSNEKHIKEIIRKCKSKYGPVQNEKVPATPNDHPEMDNSPILNEEGKTHF